MAALSHPFLSRTLLSSSLLSQAPTAKFIFSVPLRLKPLALRKNQTQCGAIADIKASSPVDDHEDVLLGATTEEERRGVRAVADYDWTEEWYPLYLTRDVPDDAPLGLTVFDKQLVLYRDGAGELRCYQDRCPHR